MYKVIGIVLVVAASIGFFLKKAETVEEKYENLKEMIKAVTYLKQELNFSSQELSFLCEKIADKTQGAVSDTLSEVGRILNKEKGADFKCAWNTVTDKRELFSADAKKIVEDLADNLGKKSLDIELENIEKTKTQLEHLEIEEREKTRKDKKLLYTLGGALAAAITILVI